MPFSRFVHVVLAALVGPGLLVVGAPAQNKAMVAGPQLRPTDVVRIGDNRLALLGAHQVEDTPRNNCHEFLGAFGRDSSLLRCASENQLEDRIELASPQSIRYAIQLGPKIKGLRLVGGILEFVDAGGGPLFHMGARVDGGDGVSDVAELELEGCIADPNPRAPWGRPPPDPGADRCVVTIGVSSSGFASHPRLVFSWTQSSMMMFPRQAHTATVLADGRILIAGGYYYAPGTSCGGGGTARQAELYDPATGNFAATGTMATSRNGSDAVLLSSGKVLVAGFAYGVSDPRQTEEFDPATGMWLDSGRMVVVRDDMGLAALPNGRAIAIGGTNNTNGPLSATEIFDPVAGWQPAGQMTDARQAPLVTTLSDGRVFAAGGGASLSTDIYNSTTGLWLRVADMLGITGDRAATIQVSGTDRVLVIATDRTQLYDPASDSWSYVGTAPVDSFGLAHLSNDALFILDGNSYAFYYPSFALWSLPIDLPIEHRINQFATTALQDGRALVTGGYVGANECTTNHADVFALAPVASACSADGECASGFCSDGVCCDQRCEANCNVCNLSGSEGRCTVTTGTPVGNRSCGQGACAGTCNGSAMDCVYPASGQQCAPASCTNGLASAPAHCDDQGLCHQGDKTPCPEGCEGDSCKTTVPDAGSGAMSPSDGCGCSVGKRRDPELSAVACWVLLAVVWRLRRRAR